MVRREHFIVFAGGVWGLLGRAVCGRTSGSRAGAGGRRRRPSAARLGPLPRVGVRGPLWGPARGAPGRSPGGGGGAVLGGGVGVVGAAPPQVISASAPWWCGRAAVGTARRGRACPGRSGRAGRRNRTPFWSAAAASYSRFRSARCSGRGRC